MSTTIAGWEHDTAIAGLERAYESSPADEPEPDVTLLERQSAGLRVELRLSRSPISGVVYLLVQDGTDAPMTVGIPPAQARDAFDHPFAYLPAA